MIEATGLWTAKSAKGREYLRGSLGGLRVLIFKNEHKRGDKEPDYRLYVTEKKRPQEEKSKQEVTAPGAELTDDDLPF